MGALATSGFRCCLCGRGRTPGSSAAAYSWPALLCSAVLYCCGGARPRSLTLWSRFVIGTIGALVASLWRAIAAAAAARTRCAALR